MDMQTKVKFTPEGFKEAAASLTFLPEEQREQMLAALVQMFTM